MNYSKNQKIILPRGAGLVGQNLVACLKATGYTDIVVFDKHRANIELLRRMHPGKINAALSDEDFIDLSASRYRQVPPICEPGYLDRLLPLALSVRGSSVADTSCCYLQDRGISESIGFGRRLVREAAPEAVQ